MNVKEPLSTSARGKSTTAGGSVAGAERGIFSNARRSPSMAKTLASLRAQTGLTQEEVANHLGISKAAVSKWECDQSLPDIALLPAVAELYAVTIDELFGRDDEPDQTAVNTTYLHALELFASDHTAGLEFVREQARLHWSCAPLLRMMGLALFGQVPTLPGFSETALQDEALECAREAERLLRRTITLDLAGESVQADLAPLSRILLWTGRAEEAESLIAAHVATEPSLSAISLAQLYRASDRPAEAARILQRALLIALVEAQATLAAMAPQVPADKLPELKALAQTLQPSDAYRSLFPTLMPTIHLEQAQRALTKAVAEMQSAAASTESGVQEAHRFCASETRGAEASTKNGKDTVANGGGRAIKEPSEPTAPRADASATFDPTFEALDAFADAFDPTFEALDAFADALDDACDIMLHPKNPALFDQVKDLVWEEPNEQNNPNRTEATLALRQVYATKLATEEPWTLLQTDPRFQPLLTRLTTATPMTKGLTKGQA